MFKGLCAFPLTPLIAGEIDERTFVSLISNLAEARVDSIGALGSTGSYAYLTRAQRLRGTQLAVTAANGIPVMTSIGAVRVEEVLNLAVDAQQAGVSGVLLAPLSYQPLGGDEVYELYSRVVRELSVPLCVYDNPATTGFSFSDELLSAIAGLPGVNSVKLGSLPAEREEARVRIAALRSKIPAHVTIGISGDAQSARGLLAGCDVWYSVLAGLFPQYSRILTRAAQAGDEEKVNQLDGALEALWVFYRRYGSLRVIATVAELLGRVQTPCLPFPLRTIQGGERELLQQKLNLLNLY